MLVIKAAGHTEILNTSPIVHKNFIHGIHKASENIYIKSRQG